MDVEKMATWKIIFLYKQGVNFTSMLVPESVTFKSKLVEGVWALEVELRGRVFSGLFCRIPILVVSRFSSNPNVPNVTLKNGIRCREVPVNH